MIVGENCIFFNMEFSLDISGKHLNFSAFIQEILMEGIVSQNFDPGPSFRCYKM